MDGNLNENESLMARIQQLEHERDELRKDIEQLCMQQAGPSYLVVATRMHFQRTAGLEQEIENLKKKLAACTRDNLNLQEELSEAYRIKSQLADLHAAEVTKNVEAEKQLKFFQGCVAAAFAERDNSIMEAEKAKEKEELMSLKFNEFHKRLEELNSDYLEQKNLNATLQVDLAKEEELNETFKEVINKFYEIRQQAVEGLEDTSWDDKCAYLLQDPVEMWSFNDTSTSSYISALEDEVEKMKRSVENLQSKLRMGLEIENHLKKSVRELEKKIFHSYKFLINGIVELRHFHSQLRVDVTNLLDEGKSHIKSMADVIQETMQQFDVGRGQNIGTDLRNEKLEEYECRDVHISTDANTSLVSKRNSPGLSNVVAERKPDTSETLALALQEKVAALLLLSQQEERHLLEKNVNVALQKKIEELQRNLLQVTNEKVKALMEMAQLKQELHLLQEKISNGMKEGKHWAEMGENRLVTPERDGRLRNLLKKTYLRRWIGAQDFSGPDTQTHLNNAGDMTARRSSSMDFARMRIENATLKESMESMEHLTTSIHRLRVSLSKVKESVTSEGTFTTGMSDSLDEIITDAKLVKTALGSSLPLSWSADADDGSIGETIGSALDIYVDSCSEKIDSVSAAGFEMVELVILASQILKDSAAIRGS
ncbi:ciliary rootlet coiled-coil protein 2-like [Mangifera indica]|uniref:ciliary rootlet coiled-coil protein 2-like n=1 Tax=Mangifera indica TaxID=29780 RepID=UPI001CF979C0|nr:ciliary rootlet coiled-coil protein 2-like [Mangifera indica]